MLGMMRSNRWLLVFASLVFMSSVFVSACGDDTPPPPVPADMGTRPDGGTDNDLDGDGLCNETELAQLTDPLSADTDLDGYPDYMELIAGTDPLRNDSPERDEVFVLRETPTGSVQVLIEQQVSAAGQDFAGGFENVPVFDLAEHSAQTFYRGSVATFAEPAENVAAIESEAETFLGVTGRTIVGFEVRFEYGEAITRSCIRGYPFRYNIKRSDGVLIGFHSRMLLVLPPGATLQSDQWCVPPSGCI